MPTKLSLRSNPEAHLRCLRQRCFHWRSACADAKNGEVLARTEEVHVTVHLREVRGKKPCRSRQMDSESCAVRFYGDSTFAQRLLTEEISFMSCVCSQLVARHQILSCIVEERSNLHSFVSLSTPPEASARESDIARRYILLR